MERPLRERVQEIDADQSSDSFLEAPVFRSGLRLLARKEAKDPAEAVATVVENLIGLTIDGRYLVESELGHGGMGKGVFSSRSESS